MSAEYSDIKINSVLWKDIPVTLGRDGEATDFAIAKSVNNETGEVTVYKIVDGKNILIKWPLANTFAAN